MTDDPLKIHGRVLEAGVTELSVTGERGRFVYRYVNKDGSITCYGGTQGRERMRSFRIDRIKTVHIKKHIRKRGQP